MASFKTIWGIISKAFSNLRKDPYMFIGQPMAQEQFGQEVKLIEEKSNNQDLSLIDKSKNKQKELAGVCPECEKLNLVVQKRFGEFIMVKHLDSRRPWEDCSGSGKEPIEVCRPD